MNRYLPLLFDVVFRFIGRDGAYDGLLVCVRLRNCNNAYIPHPDFMGWCANQTDGKQEEVPAVVMIF